MKDAYIPLISYVKRHRYILALIGIQCLVFHQWLFSNHIFTFGDIGVYPPEAQRELFFNTQFFYAGNVDFGSVNIATSSNPFVFLYGLVARIGINAIWSEKILFLYPIAFGVVLTSYLLIRYLTKSQVGAFIGALVYSYNVYFLINLTGALYIALAYAFVPLVFLAFLKVLDNPSRRHQLIFTLVSLMLGFIEFRIFYIACWMMIIYFIFFFCFERASYRPVLHYVKSIILPGMLFILMNLFWVLPILSVGALTHNVFFDRGLFGDSYFDIINAFAVFHPWWTWGVPSVFVRQTAAPFLFILPILAVTLLFRKLRDNRIYIFFVLFLVGVFLTKQSGVPFETVYLWLYNHLPGFNAFRESSKFFVVSSLSLSVLLGYYFSYFQTTTSAIKKEKYLFGLSLVAVLLIVFLNAKTIATGDIGTMFIPRDVPQEYTELNNFLSSQKEFSRILWMPDISRFGLFTNVHPNVSMLTNIDTTYSGFSKENEASLDGHLYEPFTEDAFYSLLSKESVQYVIVPSYLVWDNVNSPWENPENYISKLDQVSSLTKVNNISLEQHSIYIYENKNVRPHIYVTQEEETIQKEIPFQDVDFTFENPTKYVVNLKNVSNPIYLNFSEGYDPDWNIRLGAFNWFSVLTDRNYFLDNTFHYENDARLNSFLIDPKKICSESQCTKNEDGSYDINLTLYFRPQSYFYLGLIISGTTLLGCFGYLGYDFAKRRKKKSTVADTPGLKNH